MSNIKAVIYHNAKCSKSNAALDLLLENGVEVETIDYLATPLSADALQNLLRLLGLEAKQVIRFSEPLARELGISGDDVRGEAEWLGILAGNPILIERPIVVANGKAVIGRPAERILGLIAQQ